MSGGVRQILQSSKIFMLDVHNVAGNFVGEHDWAWVRTPEAVVGGEGQSQNQTRFERFRAEMVKGNSSHYNNDSLIEDRFSLGLCAALYCLPYAAGRMVYDGVLNAFAYGSWRMTGKVYSPVHPDPANPRKDNGYVLGAPVSVTFIAPMVALESVVRAAGFSERVKAQLKLAWNSAGYLLKPWTDVQYNLEEDFKAPLKEMFKKPELSWMQGMDCIGLATGGLVLSASILSIGVLAAGSALTIESAGRALGISQRSYHEIAIACHAVRFLFKRWTKATNFSADFAPHLEGIQNPSDKPGKWMSGMDVLGLFTGGALVSGVILAGGAIAAAITLIAEGTFKALRFLSIKFYQGLVFAGDSLRRALGISQRSYHEIAIACHAVRFLFKRWTKANDFNTAFAPHLAGIKDPSDKPGKWMTGMDVLGLFTGGALVSGVILAGGAIAAVTTLIAEGTFKALRFLSIKFYQGLVFAGDSLRRALGISQRSYHEIAMACHAVRFLFKRWTKATNFSADFAPHLEGIQNPSDKPGKWMTGMDVLGLFTGGALISGVILAGGAIAAATTLIAESIFKALRFLSIKFYQGLVFAGDSLRRALGISQRSYHEIAMACHAVRFLFKRWTKATNFSADFAPHLEGIQNPSDKPGKWMSGMDVIGLFTGGALISGVILAGGAIAAATTLISEGIFKALRFLSIKFYQGLVFAGDSLRRALGISQRSYHEIAMACHAVRFLFKRWTKATNFSADFAPHLEGIQNPSDKPGKWMTGMDVLGLFTGGALVSGVILAGGAIAAATTLIAEGIFKALRFLSIKFYQGLVFVGDSLRRALGISQRSYHEIAMACHAVRFLFKRWTKADNFFVDFIDHITGITDPSDKPGKWMSGMDVIGLFTGGALISGVILAGGAIAAATTLIAEGIFKALRFLSIKFYQGLVFAGDSLRRALGISQRSYHEIAMACHAVRFLFKRWTKASNFDTAFTPHLAGIKNPSDNPGKWMTGMDVLGLFTGGALISGVILAGGAIAAATTLIAEGIFKALRFLSVKFYQGLVFAGDSLRRALGFSERSYHEVTIACHAVRFLFKRWTKANDFDTAFAPHLAGIKDPSDKPGKWMTGMDVLGLFTGGALVSGVILVGGAIAAATTLIAEGLYKVGKFLTLSIGRMLGISERSLSAISIVFATCGNMFGASDPANLKAKIENLTSPVKSWWHFCDCVGAVVTGALSAAVTLTVAPLALLGFSKSNYHRYSFYKNRIDNIIKHRLKKPQNLALEKHHEDEWKRCEKTTVGLLFSKLNIFNVSVEVSYAVARFIIAPVIYACARVLRGILPAIFRPIGRCLFPEDLSKLDPVIINVRNRFAELSMALKFNWKGKLPAEVEGNPQEADILTAIGIAQERNKSLFKRTGFTFFSEARKIFSLGHTVEEKVLAEFKTKFEQFVNARRREAREKHVDPVPVTQFFTNDVQLEDRESFSYDYMVASIKESFASMEDQQAVDRIANLIRTDIERELQPRLGP